MDEVSFVETSSVLDETNISMNVSIGGADGGPDEDTLTPDSPVAESSTWADGGPDEDMLIPSSPVAETSGLNPFNQLCPQRRPPGIHSTHLLRRLLGCQGQNLHNPVKSVHIRRPPGEICIDINGACIRTINIHAIHVRESTVQSMTL